MDLAPQEQVVPDGWDSGLPRDNGQYKPPSGGGIPILGGSFDLTDWAMRKFGAGDPYQARKHKLVTDTSTSTSIAAVPTARTSSRAAPRS